MCCRITVRFSKQFHVTLTFTPQKIEADRHNSSEDDPSEDSKAKSRAEADSENSNKQIPQRSREPKETSIKAKPNQTKEQITPNKGNTSKS